MSVTMIHAGEATNVIPDSCELQGTVRAFRGEVLDVIEKRMRQIAELTCAAHEAQCEFVFDRNYPATVNSAPSRVRPPGDGSIVGEDNVLVQEPTMGGEDFAYMLQAKPGAYCFIANGDGSHRAFGPRRRPLHAAQPQLRLQRRPDPAGRHLLGAAGRGVAGQGPGVSADVFSRSYAEARRKFLDAAAAAGLAVEAKPHRCPACRARRSPWTWRATAIRTPRSCWS
jgi:hypothetical protein